MDEILNVFLTGNVQDFSCKPLLELVRKNQWYAPIIAVVAYLLAIFVIIPLVRPTKCPTLISRHGFALWNFFLAAFSWVGVAAAVPYLYRQLRTKGFQYMVCSDKMMLGSREDDASCYGFIGLMMCLFMLSKFPELIDTVFLAFMGKKIMFLHWYHHITVLLYSWFAFEAAIPTSVFFATVNYSVHSVMYFYFGASIYTKRLSFLRKPITSIQILQMVWGMILAVTAYLYSEGIIGDGTCSQSYRNSHFFYSCFVLCASYFVLFTKLYVDNYIRKSSSRAAASKVKSS